jgi:tetratricopeptide (TPR) repeat protein
MPFRTDYFAADAAAVYTDEVFGSGRLIAPGLVLTAGHVVDYPTRETAMRKGWKIRLLRERTKEGAWTSSPHEAELLWRGPGNLDLALMQIDVATKPSLMPVFAKHEHLGTIDEVHATGFPEAWFTLAGNMRDYTVPGGLRHASLLMPYEWNVAPADKPDDPRGWRGMSGAAVCWAGQDNKLYLFGVVQQVPANFSHGKLEVARVSEGIDDTDFASHLRTVLGHEPAIVDWERDSAYGFSRQGLNEIAEKLKGGETTPSGRDDLVVKLAGRAAVSEQALLNLGRRLGVDNVPINDLGAALMDRIDRLHLAERHVDALPDSPIKPLAEAATRGGDYESAERLLAVALAQTNAVRLIEQGKPDMAIATLDELERQLGDISKESSVDARIALGYVYKTLMQAFSAKGDKAHEDQYLQKALSTFRSLEHETIHDRKTVRPFAEILNGLGNLSAQQRQYRDAIHYYQMATSLVPTYAYAWHDMFLSYHSLAQMGEADLTEMARALAKVKETGPGWPHLDSARFKLLDTMMAAVEQANPRPTASKKRAPPKRKPATRKS